MDGLISGHNVATPSAREAGRSSNLAIAAKDVSGAPLPSWLANGPMLAVAFICLHTAIWTLYATLSNPGSLHQDMLEAYAWGREFQLGYYKHPPFWAWIAGAWFEVFPRTNWAFYLLAVLNSAIAVAGVWKLAGLFVSGANRLNATLLVLLLPFYTIQGHQFNANYIQMSLWPWTVYFFVLSMNKRRPLDAIMFGVLAAAGLLSKYYSAILLACCFAASFAHPKWRQYYRSAAPYLAVLVCALLFAPHLWWLIGNDFLPLKYAEAKTAYSSSTIYLSILSFFLSGFAYNFLGVALAAFSRRPKEEAGEDAIRPGYERFVTIIAIGPFLLTILTALAVHMRLSTNFASPIFFLAPLLVIQLLKPSPQRLFRIAGAAVGILYIAGLVAGPAIPYLLKEKKAQEAKPAIEVAREAKRMWTGATGLPLRIVAGSEIYSEGTAFYGGEDTSVFFGFDPARSPWITPAMLAEYGFLGICEEGDEACYRGARKYGALLMQEAQLRISGVKFKPMSFRIFISPPTAAPARE
jgi:4-amino-4-deoxy-L-arabinose transferase-like glycosyltransferase